MKYDFHFFKLSNLKIIHDLYSQYLTQTFYKTTFFSYTVGELLYFAKGF